MEIDIINIPDQYHHLIKTSVNKFFQGYQLNPKMSVCIGFVSKMRMRKLNEQYRQVDEPTDVLSFPIWENFKDIPVKGKVILGDIFICPEMTKIDTELSKLIIHGLSHLVGKHHGSF